MHKAGKRGKPAARRIAKPAAPEDPMWDDVDKHHGLHIVDGRGQSGAMAGSKSKSKRRADEDEDEDKFEEDVAPVFDLNASGSDEDDDDDDEEEDEDDEEAGGSGMSDDEDEDERKAALDREEKITTAWGKKKATFYDADSDAEIDEGAAAAEEEEALRLQRKRAAALDEEDAAFGVAALQVRKSASGKGKAGAAASVKAASAPSGAAAMPGGVSTERVVRDNGALGLTKRAKMEILQADAPELVGLLQELQERTAEVRGVIEPVLAAVHRGELETTRGVIYLEAKHSLLLTYITDIAFVLLLRAEGKSVRDHPVIEQLVHVRALLERMRPIDAKVSSQVQRLLAVANAGGQSGDVQNEEEEEDRRGEDVDYSDIKSHPSLLARKAAAGSRGTAGDRDAIASARPNPSALLAHGDKAIAKAGKKGAVGDTSATGKAKASKGPQRSVMVEGDDEDEGYGGGFSGADEEEARAHAELEKMQGVVGADGVFRPLRRAAVPFDGDAPRDKAARLADRRRERASRSALLADMQATYSGAPEEEGVDGAGGGRGGRTAADDKLSALALERTAYEEDMLTRTTMSKAEKKVRNARERERERWSNMQDLEALGDLDDLTRAVDAEDALGSSSKASSGKAGVPRSLAQLEAEVLAKGRSEGAVARAAASGMAAKVGRKETSARSATDMQLEEGDVDDGEDDEAEYDTGKAHGGRDDGGRKRKRGSAGAGGEGEEDEGRQGGSGGGADDEYYSMLAEAAAAKKAKKVAAREGFEDDRRNFIRSRVDDDAMKDPNGHRKISRAISSNRGLVKYRKKEERNPRVHNRLKSEKFLQRRKGQVVSLRDHGKEEGRYGGEGTGIRTGVTRSRKIKG